jgi:hypothetical protein
MEEFIFKIRRNRRGIWKGERKKETHINVGFIKKLPDGQMPPAKAVLFSKRLDMAKKILQNRKIDLFQTKSFEHDDGLRLPFQENDHNKLRG